MGKSATLLEGLCGYALSFGATGLEVERKDGREWVFTIQGGSRVTIANYEISSAEARELRKNLYAAAKKPVRAAIAGQVLSIKVSVYDSFLEDAFEVAFEPVPELDRSVAPSFTKKQGQYLAFIHDYTRIHRRAPAELDLQRYFEVTPPSVHQMILTLELKRLIDRTPGQSRSIRLLIAPEHLPRLE
jgi:DNA-binding MarR family transcriptional regulator